MASCQTLKSRYEVIPTFHYSLLTTHCSLLTAHYSLLTTHCSLLTTHYSLHYSTLIPVRRTASAHLGASSAIMAANSCGEVINGSIPSLSSAARLSGERKPSLMVALSLATIAAGVPAGATTPNRVS